MSTFSTQRLAVAALAAALLVFGCATEQAAEVKPTPVATQAPPPPPPEVTAEEHYNNGVKATQAKDYDTAKAELGKAAEKKPDMAVAHYELGYVLEQQGDLNGAVGEYERAYQLDPNRATVLNLGRLYREQESYDKAIAIYEKALAETPYDVDLNNNVSVLYRLDKQYDKAEAALRKLLSRTKDNPDAYKNLGLVYYDEGKLRLAETLCADARKLDPKDPGVYNNLGMIYLAEKQQRQALGQFTKSVSLDPNYTPALMNLGAMSLEFRDYLNAEKSFGQCVKTSPTSVEAHLGHAFALEGLRNKDGTHHSKDAEAEYLEVLKLRPDHPDATYGLGMLYAGPELKQYEKAKDLLTKYVAMQGAINKDKATQRLTTLDAQIAAMAQANANNAPPTKKEVKEQPKDTGDSMINQVGNDTSAATPSGDAAPSPAPADGAALAPAPGAAPAAAAAPPPAAGTAPAPSSGAPAAAPAQTAK